MISPYALGFFGVFRPRPDLAVSEWAERYRILPNTGSGESGPWRNTRTPYLREIMDVLSAASPYKEVVFCKGAQIGATEAGLNWLMYLIDCVPGPIMALQPTDKNASIWSKQRVGPSLDRCDRVRRKISEAKSRSSGNTILAKEFDGGYLFLSGTNSSNALSSIPVGNLYFDEVDRYELDIDQEGDPIDLALRRIATFPRAKAFFSSTPTLKETSRIWRMYQDSDRRVYEVPCPECGHFQEIVFERLQWGDESKAAVFLLCADCGVPISEAHKGSMLAGGRWRATNPGHERAGFHLSSLYSPPGWMTWPKIIRDFEAAEDDTAKMTVFTNTVLGLPWEDTGESLAAEYLTRRVETYPAEVPDGVLVLTLAADVQGDRLEAEIIGWNKERESWGIAYHVLPGDPSIAESEDPNCTSVWDALTLLRRKEFVTASGRKLKISLTVVDSGGHVTDIVYRYTKKYRHEQVYSVKGASQRGRPLLSKPTKGGTVRCLLYVLNVDQGKELVHARLRREKPGPGYCHFPSDPTTGYDSRYYAGLTSERKKIKIKNGRPVVVWDLPKGARNEPLDLRVYNTAAVEIGRWDWDALKAQAGTSAAPPPAAEPAAIPEPEPYVPPRRRSGGIRLLGGMR